MRTKFVLLFVFALSVLSTTQAYAFKTKMHIRTANMAILDAMDGGICLPGLTKTQAADGQLPPQVPLGNTLLQHFFASLGEDGSTKISYRTYLLQYAPYIRAGAIGPDGFPDMISGQLFVHANNAAPYECLDPNNAEECTSLHTLSETEKSVPELLSFLSSPSVIGLFESVFGSHPGAGYLLFDRTFSGGPNWRSVDWAHEVLYRALTYNDDKLLNEDGSKNLSLSRADYKVLVEEKRGAVAFALGYFMHMIGDGNIHGVINNLVAMPWSYFGTRMPANPVYGPLSSMQEELQHMAFERYFSHLYAPGSEPTSRMKHVDGLACESYVDLDSIEPTCLSEDEVQFPPLPCHRCNPLRSADPSSISNRCDHCYAECDPWREICPPELGVNSVCPVEEVCTDLKTALERCKKREDDKRTEEERITCKRNARLACVKKREACLCDKSVAVLKNTGVLNEGEISRFTCKAAQGLSVVEETEGYLRDYQNRIDAALADSRLPASIKEKLRRNVRGWQCSQTPIDQHHLLLSAQIPGGNHEVDFPKTEEDETKPMPEYERISYDKEGYVLDINQNEKPDLLNECILINCKLNPLACPWTALDRDAPDDQKTDALLCEKSTTKDSNGLDLEYGPAPDNGSRCLSGLQSPHSVYVSPQRVLSAYKEYKEDQNKPKAESFRIGIENKYPKEIELFLNSTYIAIPKNFVSDVFYMDRRYTTMVSRTKSRVSNEPRKIDDFKPVFDKGEPGTFSLGGPFVNIFHATNDVIRTISSYSKTAITDPIGLYKESFPNNPVTKYLDSMPLKLDGGIVYLRRFARALANSNILNFDLKNPFTGEVIKEIRLGETMAKEMHIVASHLASEIDLFEKRKRLLARTVTAGLDRRVARLEEHIRKEWPETNICMAEFITTGYSRFYGLDRIVTFLREGFEIIISGGTSCSKPALVDQIINQDASQIQWDMTLVEDIGAAQSWALCEVEKGIMQRFYTKVLWPAFLTLYNRLMDYYMCSVVGVPGDIKDNFNQFLRDNFAKSSTVYESLANLGVFSDPAEPTLEQTCNEMASLMFGPSTALNPLADYALSKSALKMPGTNPEMSMGEFYRNMRVIARGSCWDGKITSVHLDPRDRIRAVYGDFYFKDKSGDSFLCEDQKDAFTQQINRQINASLNDINSSSSEFEQRIHAEVVRVDAKIKEYDTEIDAIEKRKMDGQEAPGDAQALVIAKEEKKALESKKASLNVRKSRYVAIGNIPVYSLEEMKQDPVWGPIIRAGNGEFAPKKRPISFYSSEQLNLLGPTDPDTYRQFYAPDGRGVYPKEEFDERPGPPIVRSLDRMMNAPDPYSQKRYTQTVWSKQNRKFEEEKLHLMNSVGFEPVYNTVQINKLTFLGPGTPGDETCYFDPYDCKDDPAKCEELKNECGYQPKLAAASGIDGYGRGVYALMVHGNELEPNELGSGKLDWRPPRLQFKGTAKIDTTGSGDEVLQRFFQESYLTKHNNSVSLPGHRSCKDLNYNAMCNFIYDLDDPDDYCRQAHGWMYDWILSDTSNASITAKLTSMSIVLGINWWPQTTLPEYGFVDAPNVVDLGSHWYRFSHDSCVWLKDLDLLYLHGSGKVDASYAPDAMATQYIPNFERQLAETPPLKEPLNERKWSNLEHARDYIPSKRTFVLDGVTEKLLLDQGVLVTPDVPINRPVPTRFALANKRAHMNRLYTKVMYRHHCPLDSDNDSDCDGIPDLCDNCPTVYNPTQNNTSNRAGYDFRGDACRQEKVTPLSACERTIPSDSSEKVASGCGNCNCSHTPTTPYHYGLGCLLCLGLFALRRRYA